MIQRQPRWAERVLVVTLILQTVPLNKLHVNINFPSRGTTIKYLKASQSISSNVCSLVFTQEISSFFFHVEIQWSQLKNYILCAALHLAHMYEMFRVCTYLVTTHKEIYSRNYKLVKFNFPY